MPTVSTTGVPNLDAILGGGLPHRTMTLIAGVPGSRQDDPRRADRRHHAKRGSAP